MKVQKRHLTRPLTAQLEVTDICNHKCIHCYNLDSNPKNRPTRKVSNETVLACAQKLIDAGIFSVIVTGGEPLVKKELTKKIITLFLEKNIKVSLNTNITLLDDDFMSFLIHKKIGILTSCPSAIPASFEKLAGIANYKKFEENIKKLHEADIRFTVNMVVTKDNINEIRTTAQKMKQSGCLSFAATPMGLNMDYPRQDLLLNTLEVQQVIADLIWIEETLNLNVDILEALPKCVFSEKILSEKHSFLNRRCQAGRTVIAVSCNGDVRPCAHNSVSYGNILEEDLITVWKKMNVWRSAQYVPEECRECSWLNRCSGGCRTSSKAVTGEWTGKDMWMTVPLKTAHPKGNNHTELNLATQLQVNKEYCYRQEYEGIVTVYNRKDNVFFMINNAYHDFIRELQKYDLVSLEYLQKTYKAETTPKAFNDAVYFLLQKNMLKIV